MRISRRYALLRLDNFPTNFFPTYVILRAAKYGCESDSLRYSDNKDNYLELKSVFVYLL